MIVSAPMTSKSAMMTTPAAMRRPNTQVSAAAAANMTRRTRTAEPRVWPEGEDFGICELMAGTVADCLALCPGVDPSARERARLRASLRGRLRWHRSGASRGGVGLVVTRLLRVWPVDNQHVRVCACQRPCG